MNSRNIEWVRRNVAVGLMLIAIVSDANAGDVGKSTPSGFTDDLEAACAEAEKSNKKVLAVFDGSDWCHWSKVFEKNHLSKPEFVKEAARDFVLAFIDNPQDKSLLSEVAKKNNEQLFKKYSVAGVPTVKILKADGTEVATASAGNGMTSKDYVAQLRHAAKTGPIVKKFLSPFEDEIKEATESAADEMAARLVQNYKAIRAKVAAVDVPADIEEDRKKMLDEIDWGIKRMERSRRRKERDVKKAENPAREESDGAAFPAAGDSRPPIHGRPSSSVSTAIAN